jgi:hypothetical protein
MSDTQYPKRIARATGQPPPDDIHTLHEWLAWREQENARLTQELLRQFLEYLQGRDDFDAADVGEAMAQAKAALEAGLHGTMQ